MSHATLTRLRSRALPVLLILVSSIIIISQTTWRGVSHDLSSFLAPVVAITEGRTGLYSTYFYDVPPGVHLTLLPWVWIFGPGIWSMYVLHALFVFGHQGVLYWALSKWLTRIETSCTFTITSVVIATNHVFSEMLLNTELIGNTVLLTGFCVLPLQSSSRKLGRWALGLSFFAFAVLVREVYVFGPIMAVFSFLWIYRGDRKTQSAILRIVPWAALIGIAPPVVMLMVLEGLSPFFRSINLKRVLFPWPDFWSLAISPLEMVWTFIGLWPALLLPLGGFVALISSIRRQQAPSALVLCGLAMTAVSAAFAWQGKPPSGHYLASLLPPLAGLFALSLRQLRVVLRTDRLRAGLLLLLVPITVSSTISEFSNLRTPVEWWTSTLGSVVHEDRSMPWIDSSNCSQVVYGWNPGSYYIETGTDPCSSYFLVNLIQYSAPHRVEYLLQILSKPPAVVVYSEHGADIDIDAFEETVLPWKVVLATCYRPVGPETFVRRFNESDTRSCILPILQDSIFENLWLANLSLSEIVKVDFG